MWHVTRPASSVAATAAAAVDLQATKHHPSSVDLELVKRLLVNTKAASLGAFLAREFDQVSKALAGKAVQGPGGAGGGGGRRGRL
jgi:DNA topoisomerase VI subunit B